MTDKVQHISHLGDLHCRNYIRKEEYYECFNRFLKEQKKLNPDRIFIGGDLGHQKNVISPELVEMLSWFLRSCADICPVLLICGNHDALVDNKDRLDILTPIVKNLNLPDIWYFKESGCYNDVYDKNIIYVVYSCLDGQKDPQLKKYKEKYDNNNEKSYITFFHGMVKGSINNLGYSFSEGIDIQMFKNSNIVMLNDIHQYQTFEIKNDNGTTSPAAYSSSFLQQDQGESTDKHGFIFWDIKNKTHTFHEIKNDYGFNTIQLEGFDSLNNNPNESNLNISKKPNIRVIWKDQNNSYSNIKKQEIKSYYQNKYKDLTSITVIFESTDKTNLINVKEDKIKNISNYEIQKELILDFLLNSGQLDEEELEIEIDDNLSDKEIYDEYSKVIKANLDLKLKPITFDDL